MITLYSFPFSLPCYRTRLAASLLGHPAEIIKIDITKGEQKQADFLRINPLGLIPALVDNELNITVSDSVAILRYLAKTCEDKKWLGADLEQQSQVDILLSLTSNELKDSVEKARLINAFKLLPESEFPICEQLASKILPIINEKLAGKDWLTGNTPTIADIAVYSTLIYCDEALLTLTPYENILAWIPRFERLTGYLKPVKL
ncbi:Glutathione S-transferase, N-terminal domain protein [Psychromonas ingrahamii 37]|uniref:Glutathione S-transferase, N-terminal domain protein n=1 Tax=Psychromonas ingrahamii (strain DSM 17664 / CCUG 51855 / 37) TaxID=357804 RepID=A1T0W1_PSYIN|nr:glutathione S-transferase family protein [Psychromonas ingrahamii]ABM05376.1 Glutathione S-transferase, N-terminal domain protein [Psychromonas ingrahamii 37]